MQKYLSVKILIGVVTVVLIVTLYFIFSNGIGFIISNPNTSYSGDDYLGLQIDPLVVEDKVINFPYTDENEDESIIIKSDKKIYKGPGVSDVFFTLTNTSSMSEKVAILSYFPQKYGDIKSVDVWQGGKWQKMSVTRGDIRANVSKLKEAFGKKKPVPEEFDVKAGIQFEISAGHTAYFKSEIRYPINKTGEFWFEAFGDRGGYGLLDPVFIGQTSTSTDVKSSWYVSGSNNWTYRKLVTIPFSKVSGGSNLSNFPVLISHTDADLRTTANGGKAASGSGEFIFTSSDGTTSLPYEIESYSATTGQFIGWVNVTTLSATVDTYLYMYYGGPAAGGATNQNKTGTWNSGFAAVFHLGDGDSTVANFYKDSTSNIKHGQLTDSDGDVAQAAGQIGNSMSFSGDTGDVITTGATNGFGDFTACVWFNDPSGLTSYERILDKDYVTGFYIGRNGITADSWGGGVREGTSPYGIFVTLTDANWHYICSIRSGTTHTINGDGGAVTTSNTPGNTALDDSIVRIGEQEATGAATNSTIDEVRLSSSARSAGWIATEYNNQNSPTTFYGVGGEEVKSISDPLLKIKGGVQFR